MTLLGEQKAASPAIDGAMLHNIADEAVAAFNGGRQVQPFSARYPSFTVDDAYRVTALANSLRIAQGHKPVGRKIGFTNSRLWDEYGVRAPIWGYVYDRTLHDLGAPFSLAPFAQPRIEPEIMLGLAEAPSPGMDDAALLSCVAWVSHGFEIVQSIYPGWKFTPADSVAANGLHGALLIGPRHEIGTKKDEWLRALTNFEIELFCDGRPLDKGHALNVLEGPLSTIRYVMDLLARDPDNPPLAAGEIISTGTLTRALPVKAGESWTTRLKGIALQDAGIHFC
jgi:2-oxo-3-hexenedioate decarboxylase